MPILSRTVLCGAIVACLSSAATVEAAVELSRRDFESYEAYRHRHSSFVIIAVLLVLIIFTAMFTWFWHRSRRVENSAPCHGWQDLEKQKAMHKEVFQKVELNEPAPVVHSTKKTRTTEHKEVFQKVELSEPAPVVHSTKKNRTTDTWDKYLSMIKSPSRLNSIVGKMSTMKN